jgi:hypothetical protein
MVLFILSVLAVLIAAFLTAIAVQLIRIERLLVKSCDLVEIKVKKLYGMK